MLIPIHRYAAQCATTDRSWSKPFEATRAILRRQCNCRRREMR